MSWLYLVLLIVVNLLSIMVYRKLFLLRSISQIQAEVEVEMHSRAHQLLVRRDQLEAGVIKDDILSADERWKEDLADYMEEFEQEALIRSRKRVKRIHKARGQLS